MTLDDERQAVYKQMDYLAAEFQRHEEREREYVQEIKADLLDAIKEATKHQLTEQQHRWVELMMEKQAQSIAFRRKVIEHTTTGLVWAAVVGLVAVAWEGATARLQKIIGPPTASGDGQHGKGGR